MAEDVRYRITDFTEAQSMADDDYLLIDGETNNTRKINYENLVGGVQAEIEGDIDDLRASLSEKADLDGSYETLTAGNAGQLVAKSYTEEKAPYLFRASRSVGDRLREKIVGGTIGWNQVVQNGNFASSTGWGGNNASISVASNKCTLTPTSANATVALRNAGLNGVANHVFFCSMVVTPSKATSCAFYIGGGSTTGSAVSVSANTKTRVTGILKPSTATGGAYFYCNRGSALTTSDTCVFENVYATDLTLMLGSTIADYVYSLEQSTAGSGVAWLKANGFFTRDYYAYDAGSLQSVKAGSKINTGFNQWDEEWEQGRYAWGNGLSVADSTRIRSKDYIPVIPNTTYYVTAPNNVYVDVYWYDESKAFITPTTATSTRTVTAPADARYMHIAVYADYGNSYKNDICISLSDPARNGEYEPYVQHVYPLDTSLTLLGVPKLSGSVMYFDGDEYADDGTVTRRYGIVDMGTLTYSRTSSGLFLTAITASALGNGQVIGDIKANGYTTIPSNEITGPNGANPSPNMVCALASNSVNVYFNNLSYTNAADFKTAMNGVMLVYKLATPTTAEADPYTNPQIVDEWGTEQFTDYAFEAGTRDIPVPVGHLSKYYPNLRRRIESLPDDFSTLIAPTEAVYKATRNYTSGSLFIVNNTLYKATAAIANGGTITPGTNCTSTTLAAVIAAL